MSGFGPRFVYPASNNVIRPSILRMSRRVTFGTPTAVREALLGLARGDTPEPFRFIIKRAARVGWGD